jgi:hypothetical protein
MTKKTTAICTLNDEDAERDREKETLKAPSVSTETPKTKTPTAGRGRPVTRSECKLVSFNLQISLIDTISTEAARVCGRNKSALVEKAFEVYFASIAKSE